VVCVQDEKDPVVSYIEDIVRKYPHIDSRVFKGNLVCTCLFGLVKLLVLPNPIIPYFGLFCIHSFLIPVTYCTDRITQAMLLILLRSQQKVNGLNCLQMENWL